ncbi:MAG: hypothetical protein PHU63_02165 [Candidatus ainarchaeum sp.]|nr:hypothetical protein [Candidatus ainarchaeum sp.]
MAKGFVFSLDAAFAVLIFVMFVATFAYFSSQSRDNGYTMIILEKQANDALISLDKSGALSTMDDGIIGNKLNSMFSESISWNIEMYYYNYSGGFNLEGNTSFGNGYSKVNKIVLAQRESVLFEDEQVKYYVITRLRVWVK